MEDTCCRQLPPVNCYGARRSRYRVLLFSLVSILVLLCIVPVASSSLDNFLFFSEYFDGGGYNLAVEIYNPTEWTVDLTNVSVWKATNGLRWSLSATSPAISLAGAHLPPHTAYVLANAKASAALRERSAQLSLHLSFDGNDALGLAVGGTLVDTVGSVGQGDLGDAGWNVDGMPDAMRGHRLVRRPWVGRGTLDWGVAATGQWAVMPNDELATLGAHMFDRGRCQYSMSGDFKCPADGAATSGAHPRADVAWLRMEHGFAALEVADGSCGDGAECARVVRTSLPRAQHGCLLLPGGQGGARTGHEVGAGGVPGGAGGEAATPVYASAIVLGGLTHMPALHDAVYRFDLASGSWSLLAPGNDTTSNSSAGVSGGEPSGDAQWVGGQAGGGVPGTPLRTGHAVAGPFRDWALLFGGEGYNAVEASNTRVPEELPGSTLRRPPRERAPPLRDIYRGKPVAVTNDLWALHVDAGAWVAVDAGGSSDDGWPAARTDAAMAMLGERAWVFSGRSSAGVALNDVWYYNISAFLESQGSLVDTGYGAGGPVANMWSRAGPLEQGDGAGWPLGRWQHSAVSLETFWGPRVLLFGGFDAAGYAMEDLWEYETVSGLFRPLSRCPGGGRGDHVAVAVNADTMAVMGGAAASVHGQLRNDLWLYHYWDDSWQQLHASRPSGTLGGLPVGAVGPGGAADGDTFYPHVRRGHCAVPLHKYEPVGCLPTALLGDQGAPVGQAPSALCNITSWQASVTGMLVFGGQPYWADQHYLGDVWAVDFTSQVYPPPVQPSEGDGDSFYGFYGASFYGLGFYGTDVDGLVGPSALPGAPFTKGARGTLFEGVHQVYATLQGHGAVHPMAASSGSDLVSPYGFHVTE